MLIFIISIHASAQDENLNKETLKNEGVIIYNQPDEIEITEPQLPGKIEPRVKKIIEGVYLCRFNVLVVLNTFYGSHLGAVRCNNQNLSGTLSKKDVRLWQCMENPASSLLD